MSRVTILSKDIISKIAAGEVIERPASVVKELIENSLDAQATKIEITIKQAGRSLIKIKDNGTGIDHDDIEKVFFRHATSKISTVDDLFAIQSLGFRGEALFSISAVSDLILRSRSAGDDTGWEIHLRGGEQLSLKPVGMPIGTEIEIQELFFNTPARRKFMKKNTTELNQIISILTPYTILNPHCAFRLVTDYRTTERTVYDLECTDDYVERIENVLNVSSDTIVELSHTIDDRDIELRAYLGDASMHRTSKDMQYLFVNGRPVQHRLLNYKLNEMYKIFLPKDLYPFFILMLTVPPHDVDANVHPAKREVKIKQEYDLCAYIQSLCEKTLLDKSKIKQVDQMPFTVADKGYNEQFTTAGVSPSKVAESYTQEYVATATQYLLDVAPTSPDTTPSATLREALSNALYVGSFYKKYLLFETNHSLIIVDQHAAQERVHYEKLIAQLENKAIESQKLLTPILLSVTPQEMNSWELHSHAIAKIGFDVTQWDNQTIAIQAHPTLITLPENAIRNILNEITAGHYDSDIIARCACRQSVMAGDFVDKQGAQYIKEMLCACEDPFVCPHGRPTVIEMEEQYLSKQFLRT